MPILYACKPASPLLIKRKRVTPCGRILCSVFALTVLVFSNAMALSLVRDATIITMAEGNNTAFVGYLLFDDNGRIREVAEGRYEAADVDVTIEAKGKIIIPGFVSGHSHLWQSPFRGIGSDQELWGWLGALHWTYGKYLGQGDFYNFTLYGALDQLTHGITTTYDHSQRLSAPEAVYLEALQASLASGQHFVFAYDTDVKRTDADIRKSIANVVEQSHEYIGTGNMLALSMNVSPFGAGLQKLALQMTLARQYDLGVQMHYLEDYSRRAKERQLWERLLKDGGVAGNVSFAHFIHTTDKILADAANRGVSVIWNPLSNGRLASGLADIPAYRAMGIAIGMGLDASASADNADPFENMRMGLYSLRMKHRQADIMSPAEVLRLHTLETAKVIRVDKEVGSLEAGKWADFLIINPDDPPIGVIFDAVASVVLSCSADNLEQVYVAGKLVVENGKPLHHDLHQIQNRTKQNVARIRTLERNSR